MKLVYVISMGHSGSTLLDCILGHHSDFVSSGEMTFLQWQLYRTKNVKASVAMGDICTCEKDFRDCMYWSKVLKGIQNKTGIDIKNDPVAFDTAFFSKFSYHGRGGFKIKLKDRIKGYIVRNWLEMGWNLNKIMWLEPRMKQWLENSWLLYETMAEAGEKNFVVDSSKDLLVALLLQQYRPKDVTLLFLHRDILGLAASSKKYGKSPYLPIGAKKIFEKRVVKYQKNLKDLKYFDVNYEDFVSRPNTFLTELAAFVGANKNENPQTDDNFYINPPELHIVAGNPMRYKGKKKVSYDDRWKETLSDEEISHIHSEMNK